MKNTTKTIAVVLALFLVAALFVGAASAARPITVSSSDVFVYETIDITGINNTIGSSATLTKYSGDATPVSLNQILVQNTASFEILAAAVGSNTGTYYIDGTVSGNAISSKGNINIWNPELTLKAELTTKTSAAPYTSSSSGDDVNGKTINKDTNVSFIIDAPKVGPAFGNTAVTQADTNAVAKIVFTTPVGGKTTVFGGVSFGAIAVNQSQVAVGYTSPKSDAAAGTYVAQAEFTSPVGFSNYASKSNTVSFTVQSTTLTLTANKDSVIRSNPFTVVIQGKSQNPYLVFIEGSDSNQPAILPGQSGMKTVGGTTPAINLADWSGMSINTNTVTANTGYTYSYAIFETDASGKRTVQYNTYDSTDDKTYTIKVYEAVNPATGLVNYTKNSDNNYDSVKVKVEKGAVTVTAAGDRSYYIGEEIKLTGTNTDSSLVFLFITGPNLLTDGISLKSVGQTQTVPAYNNSNPVSVETDNTWEYKWDTSNCGLDTGAYTIYATSVLTNGKSSSKATSASSYATDGYAVKLSDSEYATVSVNLKQPFLSAVPSGTTVAKGDKIYIRGTAEGDPSELILYIFGPNKFVKDTVTVEDDGSYEKKLEIDSDWSSNQYYVVIEHPMYNNQIDVYTTYSAAPQNGFSGDAKDESNQVVIWIPKDTQNAAYASAQESFIVWGTGKLQGSNAADALTKMIDSANIDDIYTKLTFTVQEPWIRINNPGDQAVGTTFTITGTTNLAVDDQILIEVVSSSFTAIDKTSTSTTSGFSQTTKVVAGDGTDNAWSIEVDSTNFKLDEYTIKAQGIETDVTSTVNFNIVEKVNPTVTPTATVTGGQPTTTATTAVPTDAPKTPGFGAFLALAGLGAVALLVLRRN